MFRFFVITLMVAATLSLAATARADTPADSPAPVVQGDFDITIESLGDTSLCGFPVDLTIHLKGSFRYFPTEQGHSLTNVAISSVDYTISANGKTVVAKVQLAETFFPNKLYPELTTVLTMHGIGIQIRLLGGGLVIQDAGLVVELPDGSVTIVRGPHPVLLAGGFSAGVAQVCALLAA
jgi:hypothetical protein